MVEMAASWLVAGSGTIGLIDLGAGSAGPVVFCGRVQGTDRVAVVGGLAAFWLVTGNVLTGETDLRTGLAEPAVF